MADRKTAQEARALLVQCALDLLHRDHPEDLSIREVARRAGVSSGAPYHHFGNKTELLAACAAVGFERLNTRLAAVEGGSIEERLAGQARAYLDFAFEEPGCYRLMMSRHFPDSPRYPRIVAGRVQAMGGFLALMAEGAPEGTTPEALKARAVAGWSMLHGFAMLWLDGSFRSKPDPAGQVASTLRLLVGFLLGG